MAVQDEFQTCSGSPGPAKVGGCRNALSISDDPNESRRQVAWSSPACPRTKTKTQTSTQTLRGQNAYGVWGRGRFVSLFHNPPKHNPPPSPALHQEPAVSGRFGEALALSSAFPGSCALDRSRSRSAGLGSLIHQRIVSVSVHRMFTSCSCSPFIHCSRGPRAHPLVLALVSGLVFPYLAGSPVQQA